MNGVGFKFDFRLSQNKNPTPWSFSRETPLAFGVVSQNGDPFGLKILNYSYRSKKSNYVHAALINSSVEYISIQKVSLLEQVDGVIKHILETITESYECIAQIGTLKCTPQAG